MTSTACPEVYDKFGVQSPSRCKPEPPRGEESEEHGFTRQGYNLWIGGNEKVLKSDGNSTCSNYLSDEMAHKYMISELRTVTVVIYA